MDSEGSDSEGSDRDDALDLLRDAIDALDIALVLEAARAAISATTQSYRFAYEDEQQNGPPPWPALTCDHIGNDHVEEFARVVHDACKTTFVPGKQLLAQTMILELNKSLKALGIAMNDVDRGQWHDVAQGGFYTTDIPQCGDAQTTLKVFFTQMATWNGWAIRGDSMMRSIVNDGHDNTMHQSLLTFAALHKWRCVDKEWHDLAYSMYSEFIDIEGESEATHEDEDVIFHHDPDTMLERLSDPGRVKNSEVRCMFAAMRATRKELADRFGVTEPVASDAAFAVGMQYVRAQNSARHRRI